MDNCSNAHEKTTHSYQMGRDQLDSMMAIYTKVAMDRAAVLQVPLSLLVVGADWWVKVCYASYESFGDEPGDYTHLRMNWTQVNSSCALTHAFTHPPPKHTFPSKRVVFNSIFVQCLRLAHSYLGCRCEQPSRLLVPLSMLHRKCW